jgi:multisubunit Na+/H+ antiporter MnhF subunit
MESILRIVLYSALLIHIVLMGIAFYRVLRGENAVDRLIGLDLISTITLAVLVLVAMIARDTVFIDVALGLAALGFISTIALAKYMADEQMF